MDPPEAALNLLQLLDQFDGLVPTQTGKLIAAEHGEAAAKVLELPGAPCRVICSSTRAGGHALALHIKVPAAPNPTLARDSAHKPQPGGGR